MTVPNSYILTPLPQIVSLRASGSPQSEDGWSESTVVRCDRVVYQKGPSIGYADLSIQSSGSDLADQLAIAPVGSQVRVQVVTDDDAFPNHTLFEGVVVRHSMELQADPPASSTEAVRLLALPFPALESRRYARQIRGRWMRSAAGIMQAPSILETPAVPVVFNYQGRPNMDGNDGVTIDPEGAAIDAWFWTHDDDTRGGWWTVERAVASLIGFYLYGPPDALLERSLSWDNTLHGCSEEDRGRQLPECNITGKGFLDALQIVCQAAGLDFCIQPVGLDVGETDDRSYCLRVYKQGVGISAFRPSMPVPGATFSSPDQFWTACSHNKLTATRDGAESITRVEVVGQVYIEARLRLRPLWKPGDMLDQAASMDGQLPDPENSQVAGTYHSRHVQGGSEFARYGHVGRAWGIDCTGRWYYGNLFGGGYEDAPYAHSDGGYDWVAGLGLAAAGSPILAARGASPITWSKRVRRLQPLRSQAAIDQALQYVLYVSEDAGATWRPCPMQLSTLRDECGILLGVDNLMTVNRQALSEKIEADPGESWWELIRSRQLLFEIVAVVEADHAAIGAAPAATGSLMDYDLAQVLYSRQDEVWVQANTPGNTSGNWVRDSVSAPSGDLASSAAAVRDAKNRGRFSAALSSPLFRGLDGCVGKRVPLIAGRNLVLGSADAATGPLVVSQSYELGPPESGQSVRLNLDDDRAVGPL